MVSELKKSRRPIKLPDSPDDFQCPGHDGLLRRIFQILEVCSFATTGDDGCDVCPYYKDCDRIYEEFTYRGEDKMLKPIDLVEFVELFGNMRYTAKRLL